MIRPYALFALALSLLPQPSLFAQDDCARRTFITNTSFTQSGFTVMTYADENLDSLFWDFGDGVVQWQTANVGTGVAQHEYAAPGTYTVTLERWGTRGVFEDAVPFYCITSQTNVVYAQPTDSLCGGDFLITMDGNLVTFSNRSLIHAPSFNSHSTQPLWDFGNGQQGGFLNRIYDVQYEPGTYTACLYYGGFSFNNGGYLYDCATCSTFTVGSAQSVVERTGNSFSLHPNPAAAWVELSGTQPIDAADVRLYDQLGRTLPLAVPAHSGTGLRMDVSALAAGSYYLRVQDGGDVRMLPFRKE
jgi:hypothetical protein